MITSKIFGKIAVSDGPTIKAKITNQFGVIFTYNFIYNTKLNQWPILSSLSKRKLNSRVVMKIFFSQHDDEVVQYDCGVFCKIGHTIIGSSTMSTISASNHLSTPILS